MTEKTRISTDHAPAAVGAYSQGIMGNGFIFTAGQIALDPATGKLVEGDIKAQTERVMKNLQGVLEAAGTSPANVVKTTVFLSDINNFAAMNEVYGAFFAGYDAAPPARSAFAVAALPLGALVEIEAIALV